MPAAGRRPSAWRRRGSAGRCRTCRSVSLHGRALEGIVRYLQPGARILALSWDGETPAKLAALLADARLRRLDDHGARSAWAGRASACGDDGGGLRSRRRSKPLNTIAIEVVGARDATSLSLAPGLDDSLFEHDGQLTKRDDPRDHALGAGAAAGRTAVGRRAGRGLDRDRMAAAASVAARPSASRKAPNARRVRRATPPRSARPISRSSQGHAPEALAGLPAPDAVFIGGGARRCRRVRGGVVRR